VNIFYDVSLPVLKRKPYVWKPTEKIHFDRLRELDQQVLRAIIALYQDLDLVRRVSVNESLVIKKFNKLYPTSKVLRSTFKRRLRELRKLGYIDFKTHRYIRDEDGTGFYYDIILKLGDSEIQRMSSLLYYGVA